MTGFYHTFFMLLTTVFLGVFSFKANAQQKPMLLELNWKYGVLVLNSGDTIRGATSITLPHDLVVVTHEDNTVTSALPSNIKILEVSEEIIKVPYRLIQSPLGKRRIYLAYIWDHDNDYSNFRTPALFVSVVSGKNSLLLREERYDKSKGVSAPSALGIVGGQIVGQAARMAANQLNLTQKFYLLMPGQEVKWLRNPKKDLLASFPEKKKEIMQYASLNNLSFTKLEHLAKIVEFCNGF